MFYKRVILRFLWRFHPHESSPRKKSSRMWLLQEETLCTLLRLSHVLTSYPITCLDPWLAGWIRASVDWAIKKYLGMMMKWWTMTLRGSLPDKSKMRRKMRIFRGFLCFFNGFDGFQSGRWRISRLFMCRKRTREVEGWLGYLLHDVDISKYVLYIWYTSANGQLNREHDCKTPVVSHNFPDKPVFEVGGILTFAWLSRLPFWWPETCPRWYSLLWICPVHQLLLNTVTAQSPSVSYLTNGYGSKLGLPSSKMSIIFSTDPCFVEMSKNSSIWVAPDASIQCICVYIHTYIHTYIHIYTL